ncbi:uncharacterized protein LOC105281618 isoform X2 [Ooceraea biroi]|uniref:uncharacterized protein LOC105281618 isoform X2 n=1 Tax=Ooceraea biroi TaxID=2015173 RepID=UPI0005BCB39F|nr:uncharacterized protein LOC105281618 isoform X2 [Ooceraea biroi]
MNETNGMNRMNGINGNALKMGDKSLTPDCGEEQKLIPSTTPTTPMIMQVTKNPYSSLKCRSRYRAGPTPKLRRRAVLKNGDCNVLQSRISRRSLRFLQDIFTTLVDTQWRWTLLCFIMSFFLTWLAFAVIWWLIAFTHGDFEESHMPPVQVENNWTPCVYNIFSFTSCFLFSIETQHTIGYGFRSTTEECPEAIFVMCIQSISGVIIQAFMVGIVFAKMTRPKQRTQTLLFSRNAVICQRDGELCLMFRVGDMRKSHIIGASVRAQLIRNRTTKEGEILSHHQQELVVGTDGENGDLFFIWPTIIIHVINDSSPFYNMSAEDMLTERFEIVLILEGTVESTGQTTQARSSYLSQEILWGHRFDSMVSYSKERQGYEVDYSLFNSTTQVDTPLCSGRELAEFYRVQDDLRHPTGVLIDEEHLIERQCACNYRRINQCCLRLPLTPLDSSNSHNSVENEYRWRNGCTFPNCISSANQLENIEQSEMFDFDPDAIQVMEDVELQQLPEAVNREIVKNSQEIVYEEEEEEGLLERKLVRLDEENSNAVKNTYPKFYEREDLPLIKVQENRRDIRHQIRHTVHDPEKECKTKNDEFARKDYEVCLEKRLRLHDKRCQLIASVRQDQQFVQDNIFMNRKQKPSKECNSNEKQYHLKAFNRSLSVGDPFVTDNRRSFRESRENAINNMKNVKMMEAGPKSFKKIGKYFLMPLDHSNNNPMFRQRLNYDLRRENGISQTKITPKQHNNVSFENEKITRKTPLNLAKIMIQRKVYPNDIRLPVSPVSPESGFCEESPDINPRKPHLLVNVSKDDEIVERENNSSSESDLSRKNMINGFNTFVVPEECVEHHIVETPISRNNNIRDIDKNKSSSDSDLSHRYPINNDSDLVKCSKNQVAEEPYLSDRTEQNVETVDESNILSHNNNKESLGIDDLRICLDNNLSCKN